MQSLRTDNSSGPVTARAVLLLQELDREIRQATKAPPQPRSLMPTRGLPDAPGQGQHQGLYRSAKNVMGGASEVLDNKLLR